MDIHVFLSYPSEKVSEAYEIHHFLRSLGVEVWLDKENLIGGQDWENEITEELNRADLAVLLCSEETARRPVVIQKEMKEIFRIMEKLPYGGIFLIPIKLDSTLLPRQLTKYQYIDYSNSNFREKLARSVALRCEQKGVTVNKLLAEYTSNIDKSTNSVKISKLEESTEEFDFDATYPRYAFAGQYWDYVNSEITREVFSDFYTYLPAERADLKLHADLKSQWTMSVEEFFRKEHLVSLRFYRYFFGRGSAHPNHRNCSPGIATWR
jgi:hypothetical protein